MASAVGALDEAIKEYLLYRGFTQTLKYFELERRDDKDKGFRVNRIVEYLMQCVVKSDFQSLQSFWVYLYRRFFSQMNSESLTIAYRLETNMLRLFLVQASRSGRHDEVRGFFEKMSDSLHDRKEWKDWFALPFTKTPEQHPTFKLYYSKEWMDAFQITLHNFFSTLFTSLPLPALLSFETEHQKMQALATENHHLHNQLADTRQAQADAESNVQRLEARLAHQVASQATTAASSANKRRYSGGKADKPQMKSVPGGKKKGHSHAVVGSASTASPGKKPVKGTGEGAQGQERALQDGETASSPSLSAAKKLALEKDNQGKEEVEGDKASADAVQDEGQVKTFAGPDGNCPFLPVSQDSYREHSSPITHCKFSPNATQVATVDTDGKMRVWDPTKRTTTAYTEVSSSLLSLDWVPQSESLLLLGTGGGVVKLFDSVNSKCHWEVSSDSRFPRVLSITCSPSTFAFSASATGASSSSSSRTFNLTSPSLPSHRASSSEMMTLEGVGGGGGGGGRGSGGWDCLPIPGGVFIWDLKTQKQQCSLPLSPLPVAVNCMSFNHNSNLLLTGAVDGMIRLFDVFQKECLCAWMAHDGEVYNVQFSSDETSVYSMGSDNTFCQWSINQSGQKVTQFTIEEGACQPARGWAQSIGGQYYPSTPRGNLFAFESEDRFVLTCAQQQALIYEVGQDGSLTKTLSITGHTGPISCVDWLHGRRSFSTCLTGSVDCTINVINLLKN